MLWYFSVLPSPSQPPAPNFYHRPQVTCSSHLAEASSCRLLTLQIFIYILSNWVLKLIFIIPCLQNLYNLFPILVVPFLEPGTVPSWDVPTYCVYSYKKSLRDYAHFADEEHAGRLRNNTWVVCEHQGLPQSPLLSPGTLHLLVTRTSVTPLLVIQDLPKTGSVLPFVLFFFFQGLLCLFRPSLHCCTNTHCIPCSNVSLTINGLLFSWRILSCLAHVNYGRISS